MMGNQQSPEEIRKVAKQLDDAVENEDREAAVSCFSDDSAIELFGMTLTGKEAISKCIEWMYQNMRNITFEPVTIMVDGDTFFEEFLLKAQSHDGTEFQLRASEVLVYENYKVKGLRLYLDRVEFARVFAKGLVIRTLANALHKMSLKGLH